jgi:hypothetical protein
VVFASRHARQASLRRQEPLRFAGTDFAEACAPARPRHVHVREEAHEGAGRVVWHSGA